MGLVLPIGLEGFGPSVVEAMLLGTPIVTSNSSSLPEVAGNAALLINPYSIDEIRRAIEMVDSDSDFLRGLFERDRIQAEKFSARPTRKLYALT